MIINILWNLLISSNLIKMPPTSINEANYRYGPLQEYQIPNQSRTLTKLDLSKVLPGKSDNIYVNKDMVLPLFFVITELKEKGLIDEIRFFAGCYNPRPVRNKTTPSAHAFGLACDFPLLDLGKQAYSEEFTQVWERYGFCSGHRFGDPMHFSYAKWECDNKLKTRTGGSLVLPYGH